MKLANITNFQDLLIAQDVDSVYLKWIIIAFGFKDVWDSIIIELFGNSLCTKRSDLLVFGITMFV